LPASAAFSIATGTGSSGNACPNVEAYNIDGVTIPIVVRLADRYNNPAPDGTAVAFTTDGGHIVGNCTTPSSTATPGDGTCSVTWTSADPRPVPADDNPPIPASGRTTVLATAIGEESFTDINGSGYYVSPDPFANLGEPYRDDNENGKYDLGEYFLDFLHTGVWAGPDGTFHGITCTGSTAASTCTTDTWAIGATATLIMATGAANITILSNGSPPYGANSTNAISFNVQDLNRNPLPAGTTVVVTASATVGTVTEGNITIPCATNLGGQTYTSFITAAASPGSGEVTITVTSPSGLVTVKNFAASVL
jgi:hypothetical protein